MKLLAMDTSSIACSVALLRDESLFERHEEQPREHTRLLLPMVRDLLREGGLALGELDGIVLGNGPGSFIGMRIAASVAQGLALGAGLKLVPVSSLAAVAAEVFAQGDAREAVVAQDARMGEVYLGAFARAEQAETPVSLHKERIHGPGIIRDLDAGTAAGRVAAGAGWRRYPELYSANERLFCGLSGVLYPRARYLLSLVSESGMAGQAIDPGSLIPAYLRREVATKPPKPS